MMSRSPLRPFANWVCATAVLVAILELVGCATQETAAIDRAKKFVGAYGYSLFVPIRTGDYPGTVILFAKGLSGTSEIPVSRWDETFKAGIGELFPLAGETVALGEIKQTNRLEAKFAAELLKPVLNFSNSLEYVKEVRIEFGVNQRRHALTLATLEKFRQNFQSDTLRALRRLKDAGELDKVFLIVDTLSSDQITVQLLAKNGFESHVGIDKIQPLANVKLDISTHSDKQFTLTTTNRMIFGYKAIRFSDALLSGLVSPPKIDWIYLSPEEVNRLKE